MPKISPKIPDLEFLFRERKKNCENGKNYREKNPGIAQLKSSWAYFH
jgi:hypothetical protein